ncbi:MAG: hypothetical protein GWN11_00565 [Candidatus Dadabacteria bacterium]|nr:hypothetical protein [Candidatus Dadabacteria bacterium]
MRLNDDPSSNGIDLRNDHYLVILDIDGDGFSDFLIDIDGNFSGSPNASDKVSLFYNVNKNSQDCTLVGNTCTQGCIDTTTNCVQSDIFHACNTITADGSDCDNSHMEARAINDGTNEYYLDIQIPLCSFTDDVGNKLFSPDNVVFGIAISTSNGNSDPFQKDSIPDCTLNDASYDFSDVTAITLSYFKVASTGNEVKFKWSTSTETLNVGFHIYADAGGKRERLNEELIPKKVLSSLSKTDYTFNIATDSNVFYVSDVDTSAEETVHGPFYINRVYGSLAKADPIDWVDITGERSAKKSKRAELKKANAKNLIKKYNKAKQGLFTTISADNTAQVAEFPKAQLKVSETGIYRVTYEQLAAEGIDLNGIKSQDIALTNKGMPVPVYIHSQPADTFGPDGYIEFYGQALDTLYTNTNGYILQIDSSLSLDITKDNDTIAKNSAVTDYYEASYIEDNNNRYSESSRNQDPWYDVFLVARPSSPAVKTYAFELDNVIDGKGRVSVYVRGPGDIKGINPDHHVLVSLNGVQIADELFEGFETKHIVVDLTQTAAELVNGTNELSITIPGDLAAPFDLAFIDKFSVSYVRKTVAEAGGLLFNSQAKAISVSGLGSPDMVLYRINSDSSVQQLGSVDIEGSGDGTYSVIFNGDDKSNSLYAVSTTDSLLSPQVELLEGTQDINTGSAQYLIISHGDFIGGLTDLINKRNQQ